MSPVLLLCSDEECEAVEAAQLLCECGPRMNMLGMDVFHEAPVPDPSQCVWHEDAMFCTGSTVLCKDCGLLMRGICPECPKGCMCETSCSGWRHAEWRQDEGYQDEDDQDEDPYWDDRYE